VTVASMTILSELWK